MPSHLAFPIRVTPRGLATVEQDGPADIAQSVRLLLTTTPGERRSVPGYGLPDPLFGLAPDPADVAAAIAEWEDRADITHLDLIALTSTPALIGYGDGGYGSGPYGGTHAL